MAVPGSVWNSAISTTPGKGRFRGWRYPERDWRWTDAVSSPFDMRWPSLHNDPVRPQSPATAWTWTCPRCRPRRRTRWKATICNFGTFSAARVLGRLHLSLASTLPQRPRLPMAAGTLSRTPSPREERGTLAAGPHEHSFGDTVCPTRNTSCRPVNEHFEMRPSQGLPVPCVTGATGLPV